MKLSYVALIIIFIIILDEIWWRYRFKKMKCQTQRIIQQYKEETREIKRILDLFSEDRMLFNDDITYQKWMERITDLYSRLIKAVFSDNQSQVDKILDSELYQLLKGYERWRNQKLK